MSEVKQTQLKNRIKIGGQPDVDTGNEENIKQRD